MKILKYALYTLVGLAVLVTVIGLFLPNEWQVSRSITIKAKPETIYPYVATFPNWQRWSPWTTKKDPTLVYTYSGPASGVGAKQSWTSKSMGTGWMEIREASPEKGVSSELFIDMGRFQSTLQTQIAFAASGDETIVTWTDKGENGNNIMRKWFSMLMKPMLGSEFDEGLAKLKAVVEDPSKF